MILVAVPTRLSLDAHDLAVQSFGAPGYGGACPPPGTPHRYVFTVHALDVERLDLNADSPAAMVGFFLGQHVLGRASLTAVYGR